MKNQHKVVDIRTRSGLDRVKKLFNLGWKLSTIGIFTVNLIKKV